MDDKEYNCSTYYIYGESIVYKTRNYFLLEETTPLEVAEAIEFITKNGYELVSGINVTEGTFRGEHGPSRTFRSFYFLIKLVEKEKQNDQ